MTLFGTFPQFTLFVSFFMLGLSTRFVTQVALYFFGKLSGKIERILLNFEKNNIEKPAKVVRISKLKVIINSKFRKNTSDISQTPRRKIHLANALIQLYIISKNVAECVFEVAYFLSLGIFTLWLFNLFEFVDFFWFIPLSVVGGVLTNNYLTKEMFAKKTEICYNVIRKP